MSADLLYLQEPSPFWFVSTDLLMDLLSAELRLVGCLFAENPQLPDWCDSPETPTEQRKICFVVAARGKVLDNVSETIASRYEASGPLSNEESETVRRISRLIKSDAPSWALEMSQVADRMPSHVSAALPESLREERFDENNSKQTDAIKTLCTCDQLQRFIQGVLDQQSSRLETRWRAEALASQQLAQLKARFDAVIHDGPVEKQPQRRRMNERKGWQQRERIYKAIRAVLTREPTLQGLKFCAELDKHHAPPLYDWTKENGEWREGLTWKEAWDNPKLRDRIRRVRQEAMRKS